jgi:hypothetical protein
MKKFLFIILFSILAFSACWKSDSTSSGFDIISTDEKDEAAKIINEANQDLKEVKTIYKANENKVAEIKAAMTNKEVEKVKSIANELVNQIVSGIVKAKDAVEKIQKAEDMDINETYKDYLNLKRRALEKQIEAFEQRKHLAQLIRDSFGGKDAAKIDLAQSLFTDKEKQFQKLMDDGKDLSEQANQVYKDSLKQK